MHENEDGATQRLLKINQMSCFRSRQNSSVLSIWGDPSTPTLKIEGGVHKFPFDVLIFTALHITIITHH